MVVKYAVEAKWLRESAYNPQETKNNKKSPPQQTKNNKKHKTTPHFNSA